jgi:CBS domain-containing protein
MVSREIDNILNVMIEENASAAEIFNVMSELYERMTRRVIQLSEERMKLNGWGPPPVEYCFINMGSAARYEQALPTDQDNAIVYADPEDADAGNVDAYFKTFAEFIVEALAQCGVGRYGLEVMADNPKWRRSLGQWMMLIDQWMTQPDRELDKIIGHLFDFRPVWGNMALGEALREKLFQAIESGIGKNRLGEGNSAEYHLPISYLGTFITERGGPHKNEMNLRASAILPMVNGIRRKALANRIIESSTLGRLAQLADADVLSEKDARFFQRSFEDLMMLNIRENLKELKQGKRPDDYIDPYSLRKRERVALKDALAGVSTLLDMLREE